MSFYLVLLSSISFFLVLGLHNLLSPLFLLLFTIFYLLLSSFSLFFNLPFPFSSLFFIIFYLLRSCCRALQSSNSFIVPVLLHRLLSPLLFSSYYSVSSLIVLVLLHTPLSPFLFLFFIIYLLLPLLLLPPPEATMTTSPASRAGSCWGPAACWG